MSDSLLMWAMVAFFAVVHVVVIALGLTWALS